MSNSMDYSAAELSENVLFVKILSNYPNMFQRPTTKSERARQEYARYALTQRFNEKCKTNLTIKQISRKINNMKARLKDKNTRHLLGNKRVKFHDWETLFLKMWTGSYTSQSEIDDNDNTQPNLVNTLNPEDMLNSSDASSKINNKSPTTTIIEPSDFDMKIEPNFNSSKDEDDIASVSDISATSHWQTKTEPQTKVEFNSVDNDDEQYEKMSMEELKRIALISQTKMHKAQEAAARAKEKLSLYKLMILTRKNRESFEN